jgi:HTH-type transcriptional regulator / antitoxin HigA
MKSERSGPALPPLLLAPGELLHRHLEQQGVTQAQLAVLLGRPPQFVNDLIKGKKNFDVRVALELEDALGKPTAEEWMTYQIKYEREQGMGRAEEHVSQGVTRKQVFAEYPFVPEAIKLEWIPDSNDATALQQNVKRFLQHGQDIAGHYKRSPALAAEEYSMLAWHCQVRAEAQKLTVPKYDETKFDALMTALKPLMQHAAGVAEVPDLLRQYGIRFVLVQHLKRCPVDGVASYNNGDPYLGLSLRHGKLDRFWFVLFHELAHIREKHSNLIADNIDRREVLSNEEAEANQLAENWLVSEDAFQKFRLRYQFSLGSIQAFAQQVGVHESIVIGRLKKEGLLEWSKFPREHLSVRDQLPSPA